MNIMVQPRNSISCIHNLISVFCFNSHSSQHILHELVPEASEADISSALENSCGDVDEAAQALLG